MSKCIGCGANLQISNIDLEGYTKVLDKDLCERCFRIRNYNDYKVIMKDNYEFINILKDIGNTNDLVVLVIDLFNINKSIEEIKKYINNNILLVLTKRDILPKSCYDKKLENYFNNYNLNIIDKVIVSSKNNYNFDTLYYKINEYKTSNNVYVVGFTNSGKSTMINKLIYNYSNIDTTITTSNLPSTTINSISVKLNDDLTLIDTPGLLDQGDIINFIDSTYIKKIIPNKEIRPITYQIRDRQSVFIEDLVRLDINSINSLTIYMSNNMNIRRVYKETNELCLKEKHELNIEPDSDVVIQGLGFIKFTQKANITLYTKDKVSVFVRKNLI